MKDYERLVREHKDAVYRQMLRVCGNHDDAEDVLVEALTAAFRRSEQLRDEGAFRSWVTTIGRRVCAHMRRKDRLVEIVPAEDLERLSGADEDPTAAIERERLHECVSSAMERLGPLDREVYRLRELEGLSAEETAARTGLSIPGVKSRLFRARVQVRNALDGLLDGGTA